MQKLAELEAIFLFNKPKYYENILKAYFNCVL